MKVAVIQLNAGKNKEKNIEKASTLVRRAIKNKAKFIVLPEVFNIRIKADSVVGYGRIAENLPGGSLRPFMALAKDHKVYVLAGSLAERIKGSKRAYNVSVLINDKGRIVAKYRKVHLFDAMIGNKTMKESRWFKAGTSGVCVNIGAWKAGLSVCYDLRFPLLYHQYALAGVDMLCIPSAFTQFTGRAHWETLLRARAIETLSYVLAPNQIGVDGNGVPSYGHSMIIDPWGKVIRRADGKTEQILTAVLSKSTIRQARQYLPGLSRNGKIEKLNIKRIRT